MNFQTEYSIQQHPDDKGYPFHYSVRRKRWFEKKFKFLFGFVARDELKTDYVSPAYWHLSTIRKCDGAYFYSKDQSKVRNINESLVRNNNA